MSAGPVLIRSPKDRLRQVALFEAGGLLLITPPFMWFSDIPLWDSVGLLALIAFLAAAWNATYNTAFDWVEARLTGRTADKRPFRLRAVHALGFELGILAFSLPLIMAWTGMSWVVALIADIGLAIAYVIYAFFFNLAYDRWFPIAHPKPP